MTQSAIKRGRGRPPKRPGQHHVAISVSLSPEALALIDAQTGARSTVIEQLIIDRYGDQSPIV